MSRIFVIVISLTVALISTIADPYRSSFDEDEPLFAAERGGNKTRKPGDPIHCDGAGSSWPGSIYKGCTFVGDTCLQCIRRNRDGTISSPTFEFLVYTVSQTKGFKTEDKKMSCGDRYAGTCVADDGPNPTTGFVCNGQFGDPCAAAPKNGPQIPPKGGGPTSPGG